MSACFIAANVTKRPAVCCARTSRTARRAFHLTCRGKIHQFKETKPSNSSWLHGLCTSTGNRSFHSSSVVLQTAPGDANKDWSASQYLKFGNERTRPVYDLLSQVMPHITTRTPRIYDLGCGPGNSTKVLHDAFPEATITGIDSSPDMLKKARETLASSIDFQEADLRDFTLDPSNPPDLLFSNAAFHWLRLKDRMPSLIRLFRNLQPGGVLAIQMPFNHRQPSHRVMRETARLRDKPWSPYFKDVRISDPRDINRPDLDQIETFGRWYNRFRPLSDNIDIWNTTYNHVMPDTKAIVEWVKGTGLQPFLNRISDPEARAAFTQEYERGIERNYPTTLFEGKVFLKYPRFFMVAVRGTGGDDPESLEVLNALKGKVDGADAEAEEDRVDAKT